MATISPEMSMKELLQIVADNHHEKISLSEEDKDLAIGLLKTKAMSELDYGEQLMIDKVRLIKRVTGAIGLYFK